MGIFDFLKSNFKEDLIADGNWSIAEGENNGFPVLYRFRSSIPKIIKETNFPHKISIVWQYQGENTKGMPSKETNQLQINFDDALDEIGTGEIGVLMIAITGNNQKEWIWYVKDPHNWMNQMIKCLDNHPQYPLDFQHSRDEQWDTYKSFIKMMK